MLWCWSLRSVLGDSVGVLLVLSSCVLFPTVCVSDTGAGIDVDVVGAVIVGAWVAVQMFWILCVVTSAVCRRDCVICFSHGVIFLIHLFLSLVAAFVYMLFGVRQSFVRSSLRLLNYSIVCVCVIVSSCGCSNTCVLLVSVPKCFRFFVVASVC